MSIPAPKLTVPDLVVLSILAEGPMHGYELNAELDRREVSDWASISRPQVYYSLKKLAMGGFIGPSDADELASAGPERQVFMISSTGRSALAESLADQHWASHRNRPMFLTWLAMSPFTSPEVRHAVIDRRRAYLQAAIEKEHRDSQGVQADSGTMVAPAALMIDFTLRSLNLELTWLDEVERVMKDL